ncbi:MAG TPA: hypothetical protein VLD18_09660, partial [Verrucomicrobiae bacterium]|nr:hypothetical protein [Verrucomicrobiae bacterium]
MLLHPGSGFTWSAHAASFPLGANARPALKPLPDHPGNIFLMGEPIKVPIPAGLSEEWQVLDYRSNAVARLPVRAEQAELALGNLPIGYYVVKPARLQGTRPITLGVISTLSEPVPADSPIGLDVAMAWFYPPDKMEAAASLAMLAGANWVRDRMNWAELEPQWGVFVARTKYDQSAQAQSDLGLRVLQVGHASPKWANPDPRRFPLDLRHAHHFHQEIARRWKGKVLAFEPWNEADIERFGGHTGGEMASLQKAAFLGLKAGNPEVIACLNVFATHRPAHLTDLAANEAWPYFDTFNFHHYEPIAAYSDIYAAFRNVSAGKPLWVTECSVPVPWTDEPTKEPSEADLKLQAERLVKTFAVSLHEGSAAT